MMFDERCQKIKELLEPLGLKMSVGACGCCDSPWVKIEFKGEVVFDQENASFSTFDEELK